MIENKPDVRTEHSFRVLLKKLIRYGIVGVVSNGLLYLLYVAFMHFVTLDPIIVSSLVFFIGVGVTYVGNAFWAFDREKSHAQTAPKYIACYFIGYLVQIGILAFLTKILDVSHFFAQLVGMGGAAVTIFVLLNFWVFRGDQAELS